MKVGTHVLVFALLATVILSNILKGLKTVHVRRTADDKGLADDGGLAVKKIVYFTERGCEEFDLFSRKRKR